MVIDSQPMLRQFKRPKWVLNKHKNIIGKQPWIYFFYQLDLLILILVFFFLLSFAWRWIDIWLWGKLLPVG